MDNREAETTDEKAVISYVISNVHCKNRPTTVEDVAQAIIDILPKLGYTHQHEALERQAEISFKAGVQEVVENLKKTFEYCDSAGDNFTGIGFFISEDDWQEKLKTWGLDGIKKEGEIR